MFKTVVIGIMLGIVPPLATRASPDEEMVRARRTAMWVSAQRGARAVPPAHEPPPRPPSFVGNFMVNWMVGPLTRFSNIWGEATPAPLPDTRWPAALPGGIGHGGTGHGGADEEGSEQGSANEGGSERRLPWALYAPPPQLPGTYGGTDDNAGPREEVFSPGTANRVARLVSESDDANSVFSDTRPKTPNVVHGRTVDFYVGDEGQAVSQLAPPSDYRPAWYGEDVFDDAGVPAFSQPIGAGDPMYCYVFQDWVRQHNQKWYVLYDFSRVQVAFPQMMDALYQIFATPKKLKRKTFRRWRAKVRQVRERHFASGAGGCGVTDEDAEALRMLWLLMGKKRGEYLRMSFHPDAIH